MLEEIKKLEEIKDDDQTTNGRYLGALTLVAGIMPLFFLAALVTVIVYLSLLGSLNCPGIIFLGVIITLLIWLLLALPCRRFASAKGGRSSDYDALKTEYTVLKNRLQHIGNQATLNAGKAAMSTGQAKAAKSNETTEQEKEYETATDLTLADTLSDLRDFVQTLKRNGLNWVLYTGYVSMWDRLNKADETLIDFLPPEIAIRTATCDKLRLEGSDIPNEMQLRGDLDVAISTLRPPLNPSNIGSSATKPSKKPNLAQDLISFLKKEVPKKPKETREKAISDIRHARSIIHKFNNERWSRLVRARNRLLGTASLTAFFIYILLIIVLLVPEVSQLTIKHVLVFYFLGAIVGIFYRLSSEWNSKDSARDEDDYGLTMARILVIPLLSGLAALVGVLLATPTSTKMDFYELSWPNLALAAVLGYAPNIVIDQLNAKQKEIQGQISSTSVTGKGNSG